MASRRKPRTYGKRGPEFFSAAFDKLDLDRNDFPSVIDSATGVDRSCMKVKKQGSFNEGFSLHDAFQELEVSEAKNSNTDGHKEQQAGGDVAEQAKASNSGSGSEATAKNEKPNVLKEGPKIANTRSPKGQYSSLDGALDIGALAAALPPCSSKPNGNATNRPSYAHIPQIQRSTPQVARSTTSTLRDPNFLSPRLAGASRHGKFSSSVSLIGIAHLASKTASSQLPRTQSQRVLRVRAPINYNEEDDAETLLKEKSLANYVEPLLRICSRPEDGVKASNFQTWADSFGSFYSVEKIAEASYGEVYRLSCKDSHPSARFKGPTDSVLKFIPLKPRFPVDASLKKIKMEQMTPLKDIVNEIETLKRMTDVPGLINIRDIRVFSGRVPVQFAKAWRSFKHRDGVETYFPDPGRKSSYPEDQIWVVIEMENAGLDLEHVQLSSPVQVWDVFWGVAFALAKAEVHAEFEHRDLHLGNICVRDERDRPIMPPKGCRGPHQRPKFGLSRIRTTLIDYTLSRASMGREGGEGAQRVAFMDLEADPLLFKGKGQYQYDVYRLMQAAIKRAGEGKVDWQRYVPATNVLWMHHLLVMLLVNASVAPAANNDTLSSSKLRPATKAERNLEEYEAALRPILAELEQMTNPKTGKELQSAVELVGRAVELGYIDESDAVAAGSTMQ
ncbi:MAG: hypothetical protein M1825_001468 [Sarcosagium campestre]|nr:MAG: hypothetical protein M1825_001468 [Sarcosagium campestre]